MNNEVYWTGLVKKLVVEAEPMDDEDDEDEHKGSLSDQKDDEED